MTEKALVILSGGMDSTTLLYDVINQGYKFPQYEVFAITFNYGQKHSKEIECARKVCKKLGINHKIVDLFQLNALAPSALTREDIEVPEGHYNEENMKSTVVPNRNMVLISLAVSYAIGIGAKKVFYGAHKGDHTIYPDCRPNFVFALNNAIKLCDWSDIELIAPFLFMDKGDIALLGKKLNVDYSLTWTCYKGQNKACGKCGSCVERLEAFQKAGTRDPIEYEKIEEDKND
jgi:7-cyano-7-deazaguanine synthase